MPHSAHSKFLLVFKRLLGLIGVLFLTALTASAQNIYCVRAGATGANNGADWNNAFTSLPATLARGATYYIADGNYSGYTFDDPVSGTTLITIKKAIESEHGPAAGWTSAYGDGVATFGGIVFATSNWEFDGQTGGGPNNWKAGFGFKIAAASGGCVVLHDPAGSGRTDNIAVKHVEIQGAGADGSGSWNDGFAAYYYATNVSLSYAYIHDLGRGPIHNNCDGTMLVEYTYVGNFESVDAEHSEIAVIRGGGPTTIRWSVFTHCEGTGGMIAAEGQTAAEIYGCVFYQSNEFGDWIGNNGLIGSFSSGNPRNWKVYNNTFINVDADVPVFGGMYQSNTGNTAKNNVFYNCGSVFFNLFPAHSHNHFVDSGGSQGEPNGTSATGVPFTNYRGLDFSLTSDTAAADTSIPAIYRTDMYGRTGSSRGAVQFGAGTTAQPPSSPTNLRQVTP